MSPTGPRTSRRPGPGPRRPGERARATDRTGPGPAGGAGAAGDPGKPGANRADAPDVEGVGTESTGFGAPRPLWSGLTTRALALGVVLLVLTISYASSLRVYFDQRRDIAETRIEIAQRQQAIAELNAEIQRWNDPAFVRSQARERLGWVVPGETGYKVIGADGKPVGGGAETGEDSRPSQTKTEAWWARLFTSLKIADHPVPTDPGADKPAADQTLMPSPSPTKPR